MNGECFVEVDSYQMKKRGENAYGDVFLSRKDKEQNRIISVLSDGLGSGIKANVLATLTSSMAVNFTSSFKDIKKTAEIIMKTLPVCKVRKISYSTFTILDIGPEGDTRIMEYDNPPAVIIRNAAELTLERKEIKLGFNPYKENIVQYSHFTCQLNDRIVFFTDGVSQAGIGSPEYMKGWGERAAEYALSLTKSNPNISARELAHKIVNKANMYDGYKPMDDISCAVVYFRRPRKTLIATGPPYSKENDYDFAEGIKNFCGKKIICGGTTANMLAREWNKKIKLIASAPGSGAPPESSIDGIDLVTEGILTLTKAAEILQEGDVDNLPSKEPAAKLVRYFLESDVVEFHVGAAVNEAHYDPSIPVEVGIRRNIVKNIASILEEKYLKETKVSFI